MSQLTRRFIALKTAVGGNREQTRYEDTFGMPREEAEHITPPAPYLRRLLGELEFALRMSEAEGGQFDALLGKALDLLLAAQAEKGAITKADAAQAEKILSPLGPAAKSYKLILAGHAHIDMNWMWSWHETVAATLATFHTMIDIMEEYPDFCFSQSQAAVYEIVERFDPALAEKIKEKIREGRWEVTASAWVETDKNMPCTESLVRHIIYTKNYLKEHWGIDPASLEVDFSPDTFGHSALLPEIDNFGGVKYYYHCRALDGDQALYRWRAPSGKELLCYREQYWYNAAITPKIGAGLVDIARRSGGLKTGLVLYGVGDHGGGPTRRDVERALDMMRWPIYPTVKFGTIREYFHEAEAVRDALPIVDHELNYFAPGCYTTQSRLKKANRAGERALLSAEAMTAMAMAMPSSPAPLAKTSLEKDWHGLLFTHFHDILTGSCVQDSREHAMGLYSEVLAAAQSQFSQAASRLADEIDTSAVQVRPIDPDSQAEGAGGGYGIPGYSAAMPRPERGNGLTRLFAVMNPTPVATRQAVEITVWDWVGDLARLNVRNAAGEPLPFQKLDHRLQTYWDHKFFRLLAQVELPPYGYTVVVLDEGEIEGPYPLYYQGEHRTNANDVGPYRLENKQICVEFDAGTGELLSLRRPGEDKELLAPGKRGGLRLVDTEAASSNAWCIGNYLKVTPIDGAIRSGALPGGPIRKGFFVEYKVRASTIRMTVTLDKNDPWFAVNLHIDWHEVGGDTVPVLTYELPLADAASYRYDIPAGSIVRAPANHDVPGLSYGAAIPSTGDLAVALLCESKYGYRGSREGSLITTLINSATSPDPYPERGIQDVRFGVALLSPLPKALSEAATAFCYPLTYLSLRPHKGTLPATGNLLAFSSSSSVISSLSPQAPTESGASAALHLRLYNTADEPDCCTLSVARLLKGARLVDPFGAPLPESDPPAEGVRMDRNAASFTLPPFSLADVILEL